MINRLKKSGKNKATKMLLKTNFKQFLYALQFYRLINFIGLFSMLLIFFTALSYLLPILLSFFVFSFCAIKN